MVNSINWATDCLSQCLSLHGVARVLGRATREIHFGDVNADEGEAGKGIPLDMVVI